MLGPNKINVVENGAIVRVFLLEGAFPHGAPSDVLSKAGAFWESYALTHAALGFLVEESESKHVLEYYASNYIGSFLPTLPPLPPTPAPSTPAPSPAPIASSAPTSSGTSAPTSGESPAPIATAAPSSPSTTAPTTATPSPAGNGTGKYYDGGGRGSGWYRSAMGGENEGATGGGGGFSGGGWGDGNGTTDVTWDNRAEMRVLEDFDDKTWTSANYVAKITGLLYNDLTGWAYGYKEKNPIYQPLSACGGGGGDGGGDGDDNLSHTGASDSYDFVWAAFKRLADNGVIFEQEVVLKPKRTVMCLFPEGGVDATEVVDAADNEEIGEYFRDTTECVRDLATAAAAGKSPQRGPACASDGKGDGWGGEGGVSVMLGVGSCLHGHENAFLYHNATSYLRLPLNKTASPPELSWSSHAGTTAAKNGGGMTARLVRYAPELPPRPIQPPGGPDRAYIVYVAVGLAALGVTIAALRALYLRKQERVAYGRSGRGGGGINSSHGGGGVGGGAHLGARALFSSSAGLGWRSGGRSGSDFGEFDFSVGDEYEGAMFPADNYSSGGLSSSRSGGGGWRGRGKSPPSEVGPMEVPLLKHSDPQGRMRGGGGRSAAAAAASSSSRRNRSSRGSAGAESSYRGGGSGGYGGGNAGESSPPPFSRVLGTMGAAPAAGRRRSSGGGGGGGRAREGDRISERRAKRSSTGGAAGSRSGERAAADDDDSDDMADQQGPFGGGGGGGGSGGGRGGASLERDDQPEGDEVFC